MGHEERVFGFTIATSISREFTRMTMKRDIRMSRVFATASGLVLGGPALAAAQDAPPTINQADTAWMLIATALVLLMTPALAFFYGGLVR